MTLQVGLVGNDGIVIASDRLLQQFESGARSVGMVSKFLRGAAAVCCWAGDFVSEFAAHNVRALDWASIAQEPDSIETRLIDAGKDAWKQGQERAGGLLFDATRKVIAACDSSSLWELEVGRQSTVHRRFDRVVSGDVYNTARYFINKYSDGCQNLPMNRLITLAAYTVIVGGEENPHGVGGLEVVVIPKGGRPVFLTAEQEQELTKLSKRIKSAIGNQLLKPFDFRPVTPTRA